MTSAANGQVGNGTFASLAINDDTGLTITVATGGTFQDVKGTPMIAGVSSGDASLTVSATNGTIAVPAGKLGKYRFTAAGTVIGVNAKTVKLRGALGGTAFSTTTGEPAAMAVMPATAEERGFSINCIVNVASAGNVSLQVTSTSNSDTANFKRLQFSLEYLEAA
jgi:hypothetical protein